MVKIKEINGEYYIEVDGLLRKATLDEILEKLMSDIKNIERQYTEHGEGD